VRGTSIRMSVAFRDSTVTGTGASVSGSIADTDAVAPSRPPTSVRRFGAARYRPGMGIVSWAVWGLFVGAVARLLLPGRQRIGILWTMVLGVVGSLVGGFIASELLNLGGSSDFGFRSFLIAVGASFVLLALAERLGAARGRREARR
jgi:uncharacterized membrane protein YeaQ/YmgE (transglycosylase-associated protein family)